MISFEEAGRLLDGYVDELPEGIYDDLNGGVNLLPDLREDGDGHLILGLYHNDVMGRYVEIFYGSIRRLCGNDDAALAAQLKETLHHELTHHVEGKAGDRTLERWDEEQKLLWEQGEPLEADSVLFFDGGEGLAKQAEALFRAEMPEVRSGWTDNQSVTAALLRDYDAVLCMTLAQADALAADFPRFDEKIMCLGEKDILPARNRLGEAALRRRLKKEIGLLAEELKQA